MTKLLRSSLGLLLLLGSVSCSHIYEVPDFKVHITLPASGDGFGVYTVSNKAIRIPKEDWDIMKRHGLILLPKDYAILKKAILKNCNKSQCREITGALDDLFLTLDDSLRIIERIR